MPVSESPFIPLWPSRWQRVQTIAPALLRRTHLPAAGKKRLELSDGDFIDLDLYLTGAPRAVIISHGLEGSSNAGYVRGLASGLLRSGYDVIAWNMRGCSGELNRLIPSYHSGLTSDLAAVIADTLKSRDYQWLALAGFSVGGNITLKYLGEAPESVPSCLRAAITFSVPADLASSALQLALPGNSIYMKMFLRSLIGKLKQKALRQPGALDLSGIEAVRTFADYDARFIAPLFGYKSAEDYWKKASSLPFLGSIRVPTLLLSSHDDSFISERSIPEDIARSSASLHLEVSRYGGHVGFMHSHPWGRFYSETRGIEFLEQHS